MWNLAAIYGAALRGHTNAAAGDAGAATRLLGAVLRNVKIFDRGARESLLNFERGQGDAIITYENEILLGKTKGQDYEYVLPESTISIECPVALVDGYVERHHNRQAAAAFVDFLFSKQAQTAFAGYGFRPVVAVDPAAASAPLPQPKDLFTIEDLGGWKKLQSTVFDANAAYDRALALAREGL
jgi:sulfate transport system substrate-binding protein